MQTAKEKAPVSTAIPTDANPIKQLHSSTDFSDMQDQSADFFVKKVFQEIREVREIAASGASLPILETLTADADDAQIRRCAERAMQWAVKQSGGGRTELREPEMQMAIYLAFQLMAQNYVQGLRDRAGRCAG